MTEPEFTLSCDRYGTVCSEPCGKCLVSEIDALRAQLKAVEAERDRMAELVKAVYADSINRDHVGGVHRYIRNGTWVDIKRIAGEESK